jgi:hypothetical protein
MMINYVYEEQTDDDDDTDAMVAVVMIPLFEHIAHC